MIMMAQVSPARPVIAPGAPGAAGADQPLALRHRRIRLATGSAAAALASGQVSAAITQWRVPVDRSVAAILASDLIINAVTNGAGETLMLVISCTSAHFRVEVHDASVRGDSWETTQAVADAQRGLLLAAALAADSGHYRTPAGRAVYYVLEFPSAADLSRGANPRILRESAADGATRGPARGDGEP